MLMYTASHQRFVKLAEMMFCRLELPNRYLVPLSVLAYCYCEATAR
jgi:hypothetical protein